MAKPPDLSGSNKSELFDGSEVPCQVSSDVHERCNDLRTVLTTDSANNAMAVKMRPTYTRTKRPRGALL